MQDETQTVSIPVPKLRLDTSEFTRNLAEASRIGRQVSSALVSSFEAVAIRGRVWAMSSAPSHCNCRVLC